MVLSSVRISVHVEPVQDPQTPGSTVESRGLGWGDEKLLIRGSDLSLHECGNAHFLPKRGSRALPQVVRTLLWRRSVSEKTADVLRKEARLLEKVGPSLSLPRGCTRGPRTYCISQGGPETRASKAAGL